MATTRPYLALIQNCVKDDGIYFEEITRNYLYQAIKGEKSFLMHDVELGLNNSSAAKTAMSKCGTYAVLHYNGIPAIMHAFLINNSSRFCTENPFEVAKERFLLWNKKAVLKQDNGSQGTNVFKITSLDQLKLSLKTLFQLQVHGAISPYVEASIEYRIVMLQGEPTIFLAKERTNSWKHNLISGAIAKDVAKEKQVSLAKLAKQAAKALELDFCSIDILETNEGFFVLEANEQVMLDEYCKHHSQRQKEVAKLYRAAILAKFASIS